MPEGPGVEAMSNPDEPAYFCAHCLVQLPPRTNCGEIEPYDCFNCRQEIVPGDELTEAQWSGKIKEGYDLEDAARRDGLIQ